MIYEAILQKHEYGAFPSLKKIRFLVVSHFYIR